MSAASKVDVPFEAAAICDLKAAVLGEGDPSGLTFEQLLGAVGAHAAAETAALGEYGRLAEASADPVIALLMRMVLEDEERHHGLLQRIAATLRDALYWTHSPGALPQETSQHQRPPRDLVAVAHALVAEEQTGARALRHLAQREKGIDAGLHSLLLEMMAMDSDKHAHVLQFVERRLATRARAAGGRGE